MIKTRCSFITFLFNLVAYFISKILSEAKTAGYIKGLGKFKGDNLVNLNFVYDILILLSENTRMIDALK
jgi:hypothetical protein